MNNYLSHRCRWYKWKENSIESCVDAINKWVPRIEFDIRVTKDNVLLVAHDSKYKWKNINEYISSELYHNFDKLDNLLINIKNVINNNQKIFLDIKDAWYEKEIIQLVEKNWIDNNVCFISWNPSILLDIYKINKKYPLFLSYINTYKNKYLNLLSAFLKRKIFRILNFIIIWDEVNLNKLDLYKVWYQHAFITSSIDFYILDILKKTNWWLLTYTFLANHKYLKIMKEKWLKTWVFSVKNKKTYNKKYLNNSLIDIVFCDFIL